MPKPTNAELDKLLNLVEQWAEEEKTRLSTEKAFLETVKSSQGLDKATSEYDEQTKELVTVNVLDFLEV